MSRLFSRLLTRAVSRHVRLVCCLMVCFGVVLAFIAGFSRPTESVAAPSGQVSVRDDSGNIVYQVNGDQRVPSLSQAKLFLGYWVLRSGAPADKGAVFPMIKFSDDGIASRLSSIYPQAIPEIISQYGLRGTVAGPSWGLGSTTMNDLTQFISAIRRDPIARPIIDAMAQAAPIAADGYAQNYGSSTLPRVWATKFGWTDDRVGRNTTVSLGDSFSIAVSSAGPSFHVTELAHSVPLPAAGPAPWSPIPGVPLSIGFVWSATFNNQLRCAGLGILQWPLPAIPDFIAFAIGGAITAAAPHCR